MTAFRPWGTNIKGFTLLEILIVIVILAIMAALVVPRMMSRSNTAYVAEAQRTLGSMKRMQNSFADIDGSIGNWVTISNGNVASEWSKISMVPPNSPNWNYSCDTSQCFAVGITLNGSINMLKDGTMACGNIGGVGTGLFSADGSANGTYQSKGCRV